MPNPKWYPNPEQAGKITDFILWFSRYEYALKNGGFGIAPRGRLEPDWKNFRIYFENNIAIPDALKEALTYLIANPIHWQDGAGNWNPLNCNTEWEWLIKSLTSVRNNLFHGGKQGPGKVLDNVRDQTLLAYCQSIMLEMLPLCPPSIQGVFN